MTPTRRKLAVCYCRISADRAGEGLGVTRQETLCRDLATRLGLEVGEVIIDNDMSAYRRKPRPGFERLVGMLRAGDVGAVLAYSTDRLYRRGADLERLVDLLEGTGVNVHTVAAGSVDLSTASGRMVARMLGAAAQAESERTGERGKAKHEELAAAGKPSGGRPPYGYCRGYVVNSQEAENVRRMAAEVLAGTSLLGVTRSLIAEGITTREGKAWNPSSVRATIANPAVAGLRVHRREVVGEGTWEPILDRQTWGRVSAVLSDPARRTKRSPAAAYLLSGLVENPNGERMTGRPDHRAAGGGWRRTYATRAPAKPAMTVGADDLEALITEAVLLRLDEVVLPITEPDTGGAEEAVAAVEAELAQIAALRGAGTISLDEWLAARSPLLERLDAAKAAAVSSPRMAAVSDLLTKPEAVRCAWPNLTFASRREVLSAVVERVVLSPATRGRWTPLEERVDVIWRV